MATAEFSVWLLARDDQQRALSDTVEALADQHQGHRFEPHVTVQGDLALTEADATALVQALAASTPVLKWPVSSVEGTEHFFRALYLRLEAGSAFGALQGRCTARSGTTAGLSPYPHLSLAYGPTQGDVAALRDALAQQHEGRTLVLDRVALARSSKDVPIADWRLLQVLPLAGTAA